THTGKVPKNKDLESSVKPLRKSLTLDEMLQRHETEMWQAAEVENYEEAASIKKKIEEIRNKQMEMTHLEEEMDKAVRDEKYEEASIFKKKIEALRNNQTD